MDEVMSVYGRTICCLYQERKTSSKEIMFDFWTLFWASIIVTTIWAVLNKKLTTTVEGLEPTPGPLHKVIAAVFLVSLSRFRKPPKQESDEKWVESRHRNTPEDNPYIREGDDLTGDELFNDSYYFWGDERDSTMCLSTRIGHFGKAGSKVTPWLMFMVDGQTYNTPDGFVEGAVPGEGNEISATWKDNKLEYHCEVPMKRWRLVYKGKMQNRDNGELVDCEMDVQMSLFKRHFTYTREWDTVTTAKAMSAKPWSESFFKNLKAQHQHRYEQGGKMTGTIKVNKKENPLKDVYAFRDHSFGRRDWTFMIRYIWFGTVNFFDPIIIDGKSYNCMAGTAVEYGNTFKHLVAGGLFGDEGSLPFTGMSHMEKIAPEWFNYRKSETGKSIGYTIPDQLTIQVALQSGHILDIDVDRSRWKHGFIMQNGTFDVHEGQCRYTFTLRNPYSVRQLAQVKGNGLLEFGGSLITA